MRDPNDRLTPARYDELRRKGMIDADIARYFGMTRQGVRRMKDRYPGVWTPTAREVVKKSFPWKVMGSHKASSVCKLLRDHAEYFATDGEGMTQYKLKRLISFYRKIRDERLVVEYDPDFPPTEGLSTGGWRYQPKLSTDDDLIIRVNRHCISLDEETLTIWTFPDELPRLDV